jgi:hypothetical protein
VKGVGKVKNLGSKGGFKMSKLFKKLVVGCTLAAATLMFSGGALAVQTGAAKEAKGKAVSKTAAASAPSDKEIADAKAKGLVWVNTNTKVYHKDGQFYGKTKQGQFMTEADAQKAGNRAAKDSAVSKKTSGDTKKTKK